MKKFFYFKTIAKIVYFHSFIMSKCLHLFSVYILEVFKILYCIYLNM